LSSSGFLARCAISPFRKAKGLQVKTQHYRLKMLVSSIVFRSMYITCLHTCRVKPLPYNFTYFKQCCWSGSLDSACFLASWIRTDPDPSISKQK
jgi:hypothetical protein